MEPLKIKLNKMRPDSWLRSPSICGRSTVRTEKTSTENTLLVLCTAGWRPRGGHAMVPNTHSRSNIIAAFTKTHDSLPLGKSSSLRNYEKQALKMDSQVKTDVIMQQSINLFAHKHKTNCPKSKQTCLISKYSLALLRFFKHQL